MYYINGETGYSDKFITAVFNNIVACYKAGMEGREITNSMVETWMMMTGQTAPEWCEVFDKLRMEAYETGKARAAREK